MTRRASGRVALAFCVVVATFGASAFGDEAEIEAEIEAESGSGLRSIAARAYQGGEISFDYVPTTDGLGSLATSASTSIGAPSFIPGQFFLLTPSFEWREVDAPRLNRIANETATLYKAGATLGYMAPLSSSLTFRFAASVDWRGDGKASARQSTRYGGVGMCVLESSERWKWLFGVYYSDANEWKLAPIGGAVWTIREDLTATLCFPSPRVSKRAWRDAESPENELWAYLGLGLGGYSGVFEPWRREGRILGDAATARERDFRIGVGAERKTETKFGYAFETGASFLRKYEVESLVGERWREGRRPEPTLYLKTNLKF